MKKTIFRLLILILPFHILVSAALYFHPMRNFDGEYAWYESNRRYSLQNDEYNRILIMGDSVAKSAWMPEGLSPDTYNFALGGSSPIEEYYYLREYLQHHPAPEYLLYTTGAIHFITAETLWDRSIYFHRMGTSDAFDLLKTLKASGEYSAIEGDSSERELLLYAMYSPAKYSTAFIRGLLLKGRYEENVKKMTFVETHRGYTPFGTAEYCNEASFYVDYDAFQASRLIDSYFRRIIELCEENGIHFIFQNPPLNEASYHGLNDTFVSEYQAYLSGLQGDYPDALFDLEFLCYDGRCFGDSVHLNEQGAKLFTNQMREKYRAVFEGEPG